MYGRKFTVHTDHRALKWLLNLQDPSSRLTRWAVKLSEYDFVVEHRPGTRMCHADALSRSVNKIEKDLVLSREIIRDEQEKDGVYTKYKHYENFKQMKKACCITGSAKDNPALLFLRH